MGGKHEAILAHMEWGRGEGCRRRPEMVFCRGSRRVGGAREGNRCRRTRGLALLHMPK